MPQHAHAMCHWVTSTLLKVVSGTATNKVSYPTSARSQHKTQVWHNQHQLQRHHCDLVHMNQLGILSLGPNLLLNTNYTDTA